MKTDDAFHCITTLVIASTPQWTSQGTGFYYSLLAPRDPDKEAGQQRTIERAWLITNRHVVLPRIQGEEAVPEVFSFHLRRVEQDLLEWDAITLSTEELLSRTKFHPNSEVDVVAIDILDLILKKAEDGGQYMQWYPVSKDHCPAAKQISVEVSTDAIIIGYPRSFYDRTNLFPIVKSGVIASKWGAQFNGQPYFLVDAKLFPGSSGSIVVTKPIEVAVIKGQLTYAKEKQFAFLGIFSGEFSTEDRPIELEDMVITKRSGFNLGVVWYAEVIEEIVTEGVLYSHASTSQGKSALDGAT